MGDFRMPSLGADMEAGTLVEWKVKPGDAVRRGNVVAVVETDKGAIDVEIWEDGIVDALRVEPGTKVPVGTVLAVVRGTGAAAAPPVTAAAPAPPAAPELARAPQPPPAPAVAVAPAPHGRVRASPAARARARELGVDPALVRGTGPDGAVTVADVEAAARGAAPAPPAPPVVPAPAAPAPGPPPIRQAIAAAMARSKREIPHYYLGTEIDLSRALGWLAAENARRPVTERLLPVVLLLKAIARAVREVPEVNGFYVDGAFRPATAVHLGVAISLRQGGLIAPALHDVDQKPLGDLMRELNDLVARTRRGGLRSSELADATLTVTSLGDLGVGTVYGVIYPPQVALVGLGRVQQRPWVVDGRVEPRPVMVATLSGDHRVSDGIRGAQFLAALERLLQVPEEP
ncbi:dihydrolipoamide acetyltransferase family protein [Anaeromyxobacter oryzae]|uniref:Dihydrolipoamide acetyltransferase component of pyruvate dehydrogenase complex n=1 Tax=Anaeromyxobacter oryzae TaxID=2918170 RepID=A0ABM7WS43_9BACT|nr:dihydrolipoamide acetyltransferase family protein [Anaeromyxobacter oryzae]BDG02258.1 dihydrolipoamide acetyltransferase component of pyruvate dehydrogenase complex [Anaeromyxobacter oryzae]